MEQARSERIRTAYPRVMCLLILAALLFLLVFSGRGIYDMSHRLYSGETLIDYNEGWFAIAQDGARIPVTLPVDVDVAVGETVTLESVLPEALPPMAALAFPSLRQAVRAYIDGELVYTWDDSATRPFGKASPDTWNFVSLGESAGGKTIRLELASPYRATSGYVAEVSIGSVTELKLSIVLRFLPQYVLCAGLTLLGAALLLITMFLSRRRMAYRAVRYISAFALMAGLCLAAAMNRPQLFMVNDYLGSLVARTLLMLLPFPLVTYTKTRARVFGQRALNVLFWAFVANFFVSLALQLLNVVDLYESTISTHLLLAALASVMVVTYVHGVKDGTLTLSNPEPFGLALLLISTLPELIGFYGERSTASGVFVLVGLTVFVVSLVATIVLEADKATRQREKLLRDVQEGRMRLMSSQIQPHFVFNTLAAIRAQISVDPEQAKKTVYSFAKHLRANIDTLSNSELIAFTSEVDNVRAYTDIEKIRYGDYLTVRYELRCTDFDLPPLTVQPLVENAIRHGVSKKKEGGTVTVSAFETADSYRIRVEDDGEGFDVATLTGRSSVGVSTGIDNVRYRLRVMLGATLNITSAPGRGTTAEITIPKNAKKGADEDAYDFG